VCFQPRTTPELTDPVERESSKPIKEPTSPCDLGPDPVSLTPSAIPDSRPRRSKSRIHRHLWSPVVDPETPEPVPPVGSPVKGSPKKPVPPTTPGPIESLVASDIDPIAEEFPIESLVTSSEESHNLQRTPPRFSSSDIPCRNTRPRS
jgi:hypothetical protein